MPRMDIVAFGTSTQRVGPRSAWSNGNWCARRRRRRIPRSTADPTRCGIAFMEAPVCYRTYPHVDM